MSIVAIPGYDVKKIGKDRYSIAVTNGNMGATVVNKAQLKQIADNCGVPVKDDSKTKKIILGVTGGLLAAGAVAAGIIYRKNIGKVLSNLKNTKLGEFTQNIITKATEKFSTVKNTITEKAPKIFKKITTSAQNILQTVKEFFIKGWNKITEFSKQLFKKPTVPKP